MNNTFDCKYRVREYAPFHDRREYKYFVPQFKPWWCPIWLSDCNEAGAYSYNTLPEAQKHITDKTDGIAYKPENKYHDISSPITV